jgi:hypothetical protein
MSAKDYKKKLKRYLYQKKYCGVVEEVVNTWNADIIGVKWGGEVNEFEIKVTLSDLRGEVKAVKRALLGEIYITQENQTGLWSYNSIHIQEKLSKTKLEKHYCYLVGDKQGRMTFHGLEGSLLAADNNKDCFVPNKFYFAVPGLLVESAEELLEGVPCYGIFNLDTGVFEKKGIRLPRRNVRFVDMFNLFARSCTELSAAEHGHEHYKNLYENGDTIHVKQKYIWKDFKGQERVDYV